MSATWASKAPTYANRYAKLHRSGYRLMVDATVTRRMAQALMAIGYTREQLGPYVGHADTRNTGRFIGGRGAKVYPHVAKAMTEFYEAHHMKPLTTPGAKRVITQARKRGYYPPLAWDDITNPRERPKLGCAK